MNAGDFPPLEVWKKASNLAIEVYRLTSDGPLAKDFGLRDQLRRSAGSVCSNIAEGSDRNSNCDEISRMLRGLIKHREKSI
jgi:four helix bundle protein